MKLRFQSQHPTRRAFTLVELVVVIRQLYQDVAHKASGQTAVKAACETVPSFVQRLEAVSRTSSEPMESKVELPSV